MNNTYIFSNFKFPSQEKIIIDITKICNLTLLHKNSHTIMLENEKMIVSIDKEITQVLLLADDYNITSLKDYFYNKEMNI